MTDSAAKGVPVAEYEPDGGDRPDGARRRPSSTRTRSAAARRIAEGYATRSIGAGLRFPFGGYVSAQGVAGEAAAVGAAGYLVYGVFK